jgi:hypothetical protein
MTKPAAGGRRRPWRSPETGLKPVFPAQPGSSFIGGPASRAPFPLRRAQWLHATSGRMLLAFVVALFALNLALHYPGAMTNDSINQYAEATSGRYTDWHPPVMAWLWSVLRHLADGPAPFLVLHLALYWTGFGLLADGMRRAGHQRSALLMALAGAFPPFLHLNASIGKDVGMVASWLAAVSLLFWFRAQSRRIPLYWGAAIGLLMLYGTLVRANALFGLGPLLLYAVAAPRWLRTPRLMAGAALIALLAIPLTQQLNRVLFHAQAREPVHSLFMFDLLGVAAHEHAPALLEPRATMSAADLQACYTPYWWDSISPWGRCKALVHRPDDSRATFGEGLPMQWAKTIAAHPLAYAEHRLKHFNSEILFAVPLRHIRLTPEYRTGDPAHPPFEVVTARDIRLDLLRKNPVIWPATWLAWGLGLLVFLARAPAFGEVLLARALLVSALGYSFAYLVVGVATDMRYHYWSLIAGLVATVLVMPQLAQGWQQRSRRLAGALLAVGMVTAIGLATRLLDFQGFVR